MLLRTTIFCWQLLLFTLASAEIGHSPYLLQSTSQKWTQKLETFGAFRWHIYSLESVRVIARVRDLAIFNQHIVVPSVEAERSSRHLLVSRHLPAAEMQKVTKRGVFRPVEPPISMNPELD
jgi:hypothetical protein